MRRLRDYQVEFTRAVKIAREEGIRNMLAVSPTGTGKSTMLASLPMALGLDKAKRERMIVLVHKIELCEQNAATLAESNPELKVGVERERLHADEDCDIIVASVQTIGGKKPGSDPGNDYSERLRQFDPSRVRIVVQDEVHHLSVGSAFERVLRYFGVLKSDPNRDPDKLLFGMTATPSRSDNQGLEAFFEKIVFQRDILTMMRTGIMVDGKLQPWLCNVKPWRIQTEVDISKVETNRGDFALNDLADTVDNPERNKLIVDKYKELGEDAPFFGFTVNVAHSENLAQAFRDQGIECYAISGAMPMSERSRLQEEFKAGKVRGLTSCAVLCLDEKTEILTRRGWANCDDISFDDKVANWDNGRVFFAEPKDILVRPREAGEEMVVLQNQRHSIRVTANHKMVHGCRNGVWHKSEAISLVGKEADLPASGIADPERISVRRNPVAWSTRSRRVAGLAYKYRNSNGMDRDASLRAAKLEVDRRLSQEYLSPRDLSLDQCRFIGFWIGDGSRTKLQRGGVEYTLCQSTAYPKIIEWATGILNAIGVDYIRRDHPTPSGCINGKSYVTWHLPRGTGSREQSRRGLFSIEPYLLKDGSDLFWGLNEEQFDALIEGLWYADGDHGSADSVPKSKRICSARKALVDLLQAIGCCRGGLVSVSESKGNRNKNERYGMMWNIHFRKQDRFHMIEGGTLEIESEPYKNESVWCVTTDSGNIITRRNGRVVVTGNSEGIDIPSVGCLLMCRPTKSGLLFRQQIGRGLRPHPAPEAVYAAWRKREDPGPIKPYCVILDFMDMAGRHALNAVPTLFGITANFNMKGQTALEVIEELEAIKEKNPEVQPSMFEDMDSIHKAVAQSINLFATPKIPPEAAANSPLAWMTGLAEGVYQLTLPDKGMLTISQDQLGQWEIHSSKNGHRVLIEAVADLAEAFRIADSEVPPSARLLLKSDANWRKMRPSEKQIFKISELYPEMRAIYPKGVEGYKSFAAMITEKYTKGEASTLIGTKLSQKKGAAA